MIFGRAAGRLADKDCKGRSEVKNPTCSDQDCVEGESERKADSDRKG